MRCCMRRCVRAGAVTVPPTPPGQELPGPLGHWHAPLPLEGRAQRCFLLSPSARDGPEELPVRLLLQARMAATLPKSTTTPTATFVRAAAVDAGLGTSSAGAAAAVAVVWPPSSGAEPAFMSSQSCT